MIKKSMGYIGAIMVGWLHHFCTRLLFKYISLIQMS